MKATFILRVVCCVIYSTYSQVQSFDWNYCVRFRYFRVKLNCLQKRVVESGPREQEVLSCSRSEVAEEEGSSAGSWIRIWSSLSLHLEPYRKN